MILKWFKALVTLIGVAGAFLFSACSTDSKQLKLSREAFLREDFAFSEAALHTPEIVKQSENRFLHYASLASIAMSSGQYEKALYYLNKSRDWVRSLRSSTTGFNWFSKDYLSNGIEYSYLHHFLILANLLLAEEGRTSEWSTPEIKSNDGVILVPKQVFPSREFTSKERSEFFQRARSEFLAWDAHLQGMSRSEDNEKLYHEDLWARLFASYFHSRSSVSNEKRTAELLAGDAINILKKNLEVLPSSSYQKAGIELFSQNLKKNLKNPTLFVLEAGVMKPYRIRRYHLGLSTLFKGIENPILRAQMEQIGFQILFTYAPEFGLTLFAGALAGAVDSGHSDDEEFDGPPRQFSEAVDQSFGFLIPFPALETPPEDTRVELVLDQKDPVILPVVSPVQEIIATDLKNRESRDQFKESMRIGLQYLAILIPAIKTVSDADREGNLFKKLAAIAGYYLAKKAIDAANRPDLRSWNYLPQLIAANVMDVPPGVYSVRVIFDNALGKFEKDLGKIEFKASQGSFSLIRKRVGEVPVLIKPRSFETIKP